MCTALDLKPKNALQGEQRVCAIPSGISLQNWHLFLDLHNTAQPQESIYFALRTCWQHAYAHSKASCQHFLNSNFISGVGVT